MCHLILLMPVIALPIFWLMPPNFAVPIYVVIASVSGFLYWLITKSMRKPVTTGTESLINTEAEVLSRSSRHNQAKYLVRAAGELWTARCTDALKPGETVNITAMDGISLIVERRHSDSIKAKQTGKNSKERHCH